MDATEVYERVESEFAGDPDVELGTGFGRSPGLRANGKIFAMLVADRIVLKLPAGRCEELRTDGSAETFRVGRREMREWVAVHPGADVAWPELAHEARAFVAVSPG